MDLLKIAPHKVPQFSPSSPVCWISSGRFKEIAEQIPERSQEIGGSFQLVRRLSPWWFWWARGNVPTVFKVNIGEPIHLLGWSTDISSCRTLLLSRRWKKTTTHPFLQVLLRLIIITSRNYMRHVCSLAVTVKYPVDRITSDVGHPSSTKWQGNPSPQSWRHLTAMSSSLSWWFRDFWGHWWKLSLHTELADF